MSTTTRSSHPLIGEVYMVKFDGAGSVQRKYRPALVFQNNVGNKYSPNVVVLPFTSVRKRRISRPTSLLTPRAAG